MPSLTSSQEACRVADVILTHAGKRNLTGIELKAGGEPLFDLVQQDGEHVLRVARWVYRSSGFWPPVLSKGGNYILNFKRNYEKLRGEFIAYAQASLNAAHAENPNYDPAVDNPETHLGAYALRLDEQTASPEEVACLPVIASPSSEEVVCLPFHRHVVFNKKHGARSIYRNPSSATPRIPTLSAVQLAEVKAGGTTHHWTRAFAKYLAKETDFRPIVSYRPSLSSDEVALVAAGQPCPRCSGIGLEPILSGGLVTAIVAYYRYLCPCDRTVRFYRVWNRPDIVQERFQKARLDTLAPKPGLPISLADQAYIIAEVNRVPKECFFLYGLPEKGKTHILTALYRRAIENAIIQEDEKDLNGNMVFRATTNRLLTELRNWSLRDRSGESQDQPPKPTVTVEALDYAHRFGFRVSLFLDEFDKIKGSEWELNQLFDLIDTVYKHEGQVVTTSNVSPSGLLRRWDSPAAAAIIRRIGEGSGTHTINFDNPRRSKTPDVVSDMAVVQAPAFEPSVRFPPFLAEEAGDNKRHITQFDTKFDLPLRVPQNVVQETVIVKPVETATTEKVDTVAPTAAVSTSESEEPDHGDMGKPDHGDMGKPDHGDMGKPDHGDMGKPAPESDETTEPSTMEGTVPDPEPASFRKGGVAISGVRGARSYED
jgi:hypothetical protein